VIVQRTVASWEQAQNVVWSPVVIFVTTALDGTAWCRLTIFNGDNLPRLILRSPAAITSVGVGYSTAIIFAPGLVLFRRLGLFVAHGLVSFAEFGEIDGDERG